MVLQIGGSISFAPKGEGKKAEWLSYDTRHMLAELTPKPECSAPALGSTNSAAGCPALFVGFRATVAD